eukprot:6201670-Pleurochrysis_carterae.AAC.2
MLPLRPPTRPTSPLPLATASPPTTPLNPFFTSPSTVSATVSAPTPYRSAALRRLVLRRHPIVRTLADMTRGMTKFGSAPSLVSAHAPNFASPHAASSSSSGSNVHTHKSAPRPACVHEVSGAGQSLVNMCVCAGSRVRQQLVARQLPCDLAARSVSGIQGGQRKGSGERAETGRYSEAKAETEREHEGKQKSSGRQKGRRGIERGHRGLQKRAQRAQRAKAGRGAFMRIANAHHRQEPR